MSTLASRARRAAPWISTQVDYGLDCTDSDPAKWTPFGVMADRLQASNDQADAKSSDAKEKGPAARVER